MRYHAGMGWRNAGFTAVALVAASLLARAGVALAQTTAAAPPGCSAGTTVVTASGPVCGVTSEGETSYLDIPYAAPPIGGLRWQPPQPVMPWTTTYQATQLGPQCLSPGISPGSVQAGSSEDCLYLEVHKPAAHGQGRTCR